MQNNKIKKACPLNKILNYLGKKWTLAILQELNGKKKRFNDLIENIENINPRTLSKRLKELENSNIISRKKYNETPPKVEYTLTDKGKKLIKCFKYLDQWTNKFNVK